MRVILGVDAISHPLTGIGRYTLELATGLQRSAGVDARFFTLGRWIASPGDLARPQRVSSILRRNLGRIPLGGGLRQLYHGLSRHVFARQVRKLEGFLYHSPNFYTVPFEGPTIATIHDLSILHHPHWHTPERVALMSREIPVALERADHVIVVSEHVRRDVINTFGLPPERVSVTHLGVDAGYKPRSPVELAPTLANYGLEPERYVLCVATLEPRKNIASLIAAFSLLPESLQARHPLLLIGDKGWKNEDIHRDLGRLASAGRARYLGYVPEGLLPLFYAGATVFAYPSLFEGFGLPVLEAMASGVPVITSNRSSLPEVAGDAACIVEPMDVSGLSRKLNELLEDEGIRRNLVGRGLARAGRFTWARCVDATLAVYRKVRAD